MSARSTAKTSALVVFRACLLLVALLGVSRTAQAAVFYSSEFVTGVSVSGVSSLNTHLHSTSSLPWTATFDYGLTSSYGSSVAGTGGNNNVPPFYDGNIASVPITGLACATIYHWSVVVAGTHDTDQTFTTSACPTPAISVSPSSAGFGSIPQGVTQPRTVTISNPGTANLVVSSITLGGAHPEEFSIALGTCASLTPTVSAGGNCTLSVSFAPDSLGWKAGTLHVASNAGATVSIGLSGAGAANGSVPTLSEWGTIVLALAFAIVLVVQARNGVTGSPA